MLLTPRSPPPRAHLALSPALRVLAPVFVATGAAGLLAEQCFEKLLSRLLGASTPAAAVVLAVYFLGLSLGAAAYPQIRTRVTSPLRLYAGLEAGIALWSIALRFGADASVRAFTPLLRVGAGSFALLELLRGVVACAWILPPTLLMGLTFPAIVEVLERARLREPRRAISRFYTLNLVGAAAGAALGPYVAFPALGLDGVLIGLTVVDGLAATVALVLARRVALAAADAAPPAGPGGAGARGSVVVLSLAFGSGFMLFGLEVVWTHLVAVTIGSSVYAFAAMLFWVLVGMVLGAALATRVFDDARPISAAAVGGLMALGSALLAVQHTAWPHVSHVFLALGGGVRSFASAEALRSSVAGALLLPPATALGMVYPALFRLDELREHERPSTVARMGAVNAIGCLLGSLLVGFVLIPRVGSQATSRAIGVALAALGLLLVARFVRGARRLPLALACGATLGLWAILPVWDRLGLTEGGNVYFRPHFVRPGSRLEMFHEDTLGGVTTVVSEGGVRTLLTNGKFQASSAGETLAQEAFAKIPLLLSRRLDSALVIGLGSGSSAHVLDRAGFGRIDVAELSPGIVKAARENLADLNDHVLERPNVRLVLEDGRNALLLEERTYDLVSMEVSSVWFAGATSVYSAEFYDAVRAHLNGGGLLQQWVQLHHLTLVEVASIVATVRSVFPYVELYFRGGQGIIVASDAPIAMREAGLRAFFAYAGPQRGSSGAELLDLARSRLLSSAAVERLVQMPGLVVNTDWNRFLEYATPRYATSPIDHLSANVAALKAVEPASVMDVAPELSPAMAVRVDRELGRLERAK